MTSSQPAGWTAAELAQAAARGQLDLHYQPLVDLRDHRIAGAEALMRWRHPRLGLLPPGQFLPLAESFGLMPEIGAWVLGEACRQMHKWQGPAWQPFRLAINVSASQVGPTFDDEVKRVLADMALPAELLEIELTESVAFGNPALFASFDALRAIGVRFAADDFGTGYSCLQHLKCCPITTLKIDQSFVARLPDDARDQTIVRAVIQLAHGLGMDVIFRRRLHQLIGRNGCCAWRRTPHGFQNKAWPLCLMRLGSVRAVVRRSSVRWRSRRRSGTKRPIWRLRRWACLGARYTF